jgi:hypothetical protein
MDCLAPRRTHAASRMARVSGYPEVAFGDLGQPWRLGRRLNVATKGGSGADPSYLPCGCPQ